MLLIVLGRFYQFELVANRLMLLLTNTSIPNISIASNIPPAINSAFDAFSIFFPFFYIIVDIVLNELVILVKPIITSGPIR